MVRHNNMIPNGHFHKKWQKHVRQNLNQPFKKIRRNLNRIKKAKAKAPAPTQLFRPVVRCPTNRHQSKVRLGKGFSLSELKAAKFPILHAKSFGVAIDYRRKNSCSDTVLRNSERLHIYFTKLVNLKHVNMFKSEDKCVSTDFNKIDVTKKVIKSRICTEEEKKFSAFKTLREARSEIKRMTRKLKSQKNKLDQLEDKK